MSLAKKLQVKDGERLLVLNAPRGLKLDVPLRTSSGANAMIVFARNKSELHALGEAVFEAARRDKLAWVAYPKAGQLGTDLSRDILWNELEKERIRPVRQVAIDDVWSALRFRPL